MAEKSTTKNKSNNWTFGTGRRKTAIARVALKKGTHEIVVNDKPIAEYFLSLESRNRIVGPLKVVDHEKDFNLSVKVSGGGQAGQVDAIIHGIANALIAYDETLRPTLAREGLLTRDPRAKERRKYGMAGKARAKKQSPKR